MIAIPHKLVVAVLAVAGLSLTAYTVFSGERGMPPAAPVAQPARAPFHSVVAAAGLVEASTQNINIGSDIAGIATAVHVKVGDRVQAGDPLFSLDVRQAQADLALRETRLETAREGLERLTRLPRPEDVPQAEARVLEMRAAAVDASEQLALVEGVSDARAVSLEELQKRRQSLRGAQARLNQAEAALRLLKAGAWPEDLNIARAQVKAAQAEVDAARTVIERSTVKAPVAGEVLQLNVRPGEFVDSRSTSAAPVVLGETRVLDVRVEVDENDAWRVRRGARATGSLRGNSEIRTPLRYVRTEPFVVPKRSLTGASTERVDTRVLQVVYAFDRGDLPIFVGEQMDVFIEAAEPAAQPAPAEHATQAPASGVAGARS
jgi:HlyD family secretion protein